MATKTQIIRCPSIRELIVAASQGKPINMHFHKLFDCQDCDLDSDEIVFDDFSDDLELKTALMERSYEERKEKASKLFSHPDDKDSSDSDVDNQDVTSIEPGNNDA